MNAANHKFVDLQPLDSNSANKEPTDGQGTNGQGTYGDCAYRDGAQCDGTDGMRACRGCWYFPNACEL